ncbi:hypothetical protein [Desmospora profundinema]|uniref:Uncharacterized protein YycO n=1 Tax=Desmospora profundinema TaxID=1571184 RepID=A0ABU1IJM9_9BACL|nr:hypothetical protein [Desmospora profundinema]MDR6224035.1 uncharacterized protein YycO [Desmospora profundinema]
MKRKIILMLSSLAVAALLIAVPVTLANQTDSGNGMSGMMNGSMMNMMDAMDSPQGKQMMEDCAQVMKTYGEDNKN